MACRSIEYAVKGGMGGKKELLFTFIDQHGGTFLFPQLSMLLVQSLQHLSTNDANLSGQ